MKNLSFKHLKSIEKKIYIFLHQPIPYFMCILLVALKKKKKNPRELTWITSVVMAVLTSVTCSSLPWDYLVVGQSIFYRVFWKLI